jgi:hypothetical protein
MQHPFKENKNTNYPLSDKQLQLFKFQILKIKQVYYLSNRRVKHLNIIHEKTGQHICKKNIFLQKIITTTTINF